MSTRKITIAIGAAAAFGLIATPFAVADSTQPASVSPAPTTIAFGKDGKLVDGNTVAEWQISNLKPSTDVLSQHLNGTLWEATAEYSAERGSSQPFVPNLNARTADGENYRVLWGAATPQGLNPAGLSEGQKKRLGLARAFYQDRPLVLLDEPTATLDRAAAARVRAALRQYLAGKTVLIATHDAALLALADHRIDWEVSP